MCKCVGVCMGVCVYVYVYTSVCVCITIITIINERFLDNNFDGYDCFDFEDFDFQG